uniref:uncharacterized protein LOC120342180 n=1 Tax=Styela clava TaxID=7725 RepID=UPI00193A8A89|nr:uncharacterized protein LOC120342180 [Styela clava]
MVYNVSGNVKDDGKVPLTESDPEGQWETGSTETMLRGKSRKRGGVNVCCIAVPWLLVIVCLLLMGGIGSWGWGEHYKLKELIEQQKQKNDVTVNEDMLPVAPNVINDNKEPIDPLLDISNPLDYPMPVNEVIIIDPPLPEIQISEEIDIGIDLEPDIPIETLDKENENVEDIDTEGSNLDSEIPTETNNATKPSEDENQTDDEILDPSMMKPGILSSNENVMDDLVPGIINPSLPIFPNEPDLSNINGMISDLDDPDFPSDVFNPESVVPIAFNDGINNEKMNLEVIPAVDDTKENPE